MFDAFQDWVIANQTTSPLFVYFLNPHARTRDPRCWHATTNVLTRMTWLGRDRRCAAALAGLLAGWRLAIAGGVRLLRAWGSSGCGSPSMETLALILVSPSAPRC